MAEPVSIRVEGAETLRRSITAAQGDLKNLRGLHRRVAEAVVPFVVYTTPRLDGALLGTIRAGATNKAAIIRAGSKAVPYAGVTHYGWPVAKIPRKTQSPHPWMIEAIQRSEPFWFGIFFTGIQKILDEIGNT